MYDEYRHLIREHVFDKCWQLAITWAELEELVDQGEVIEEHDLGDAGVKEIRLLLEWKLPLHLVYVVNEREQLVIYRTVYVPDAAHWHPGLPAEETAVTCVMCDGTLVAVTRPKALERDGRLAVVRDVPVEVCESCGEV